MKKFAFEHGPVRAQGCTVCHRIGPGSTNLPKNHPGIVPLPKDKVNSLCLVCHDDRDGAGYEVVHKAISQKSCVGCHNPHGSQNAHLLRVAAISDLCFSCHTQMKAKPHGGHLTVLTDKKACSLCHDSHFSHRKNLLKAPTKTLCFQCHDKDVTRKSGETIGSIAKLLEVNRFHHKPVDEGKCEACHDPHGSANLSFLKRGFNGPDFPLCMECHKPELIGEAMTQTATNFRNGQTNLHYLHLHNRLKIKGCNACHDIHATPQPKLIHTQMEFGDWKVPIQYKNTATGGSCLAACHREKKYDRVNAVNNTSGR